MDHGKQFDRQMRTKLGRQIRTMREAHGWTQSELGELCGTGKAQISKIENGDLSQPELRLLKIAEIFGYELRFVSSPQKLWLHARREEAYKTTVCDLLRTRSVQQIDLLQFSGYTAIPVLETVAEYSPNAHIRLLLASHDLAASYSWPNMDNFHQTRIASTVHHCRLITYGVLKQNRDAKFTADVWYYRITPSIAGIIADDWLVSVGWYRPFPNDESPTGIALLGHDFPTITGIEEQAQLFRSMVRDQVEALVANRLPNVSFP